MKHTPIDAPVKKTDEEWRAELTPAQYDILRRAGTERAFTGPYVDEKTPGMYTCAGCGAELFSSDTKFDSGIGLAELHGSAVAAAVTLREDKSMFMRRTEVLCSQCGGHLGHVFPDGPGESGQRYCINGCALELKPAADE